MIAELIKISKEHQLIDYSSTKQWFNSYQTFTQNRSPIEAAIIGGFMSQQFSFAFLSGYQAAIRRMFLQSSTNKMLALCVSEANGGHPKAIETKLSNNKVTEVKTYVTADSDADELLVLCKTEEESEGRSKLRMIRLQSNDPNITIENFDIPFLKEIKHGKLKLQDVAIEPDQVLKGDGFSDYTRPFRSVEDINVSAAYQAMLLRQSIDYNWDENLRDQLQLHIANLKYLNQLPPDDPETILLIAAQEKRFEALLSSIESNIETKSPESFRVDWTANKKVLSLGTKLKEQRLQKSRIAIYSTKYPL